MDFSSEGASHASSHFTSCLAAFGVDPMPLTAPTTLPAAKALVRWRYTSQLFGCLKWEVATMIKGARAETHPNYSWACVCVLDANVNVHSRNPVDACVKRMRVLHLHRLSNRDVIGDTGTFFDNPACSCTNVHVR